MGVLTEECLAQALAQYFDLPYKKLMPEDLDESLLKDFPEKKILEESVLPFGKKNGKIRVACCDPLSMKGCQEIKEIYSSDIQVFVCSNSAIVKAFLHVRKKRQVLAWEGMSIPKGSFSFKEKELKNG